MKQAIVRTLCPYTARAVGSAIVSAVSASTTWIAQLHEFLGLVATAVAITAGLYSIRASMWAIRANKIKIKL